MLGLAADAELRFLPCPGSLAVGAELLRQPGEPPGRGVLRRAEGGGGGVMREISELI